MAAHLLKTRTFVSRLARSLNTKARRSSMSVDHDDPVNPTSSTVEERQTAYPGGLLFPDSDIQALARGLPQSFRPLLTVVLDALSEPETVGLDATAVSLIRHMAEDYREQAYRRLMSGVVKAIEDGTV